MEDLVYFYPDGHQAHYEPGHPENPERVEAIRSALEQDGQWQIYPKLPPRDIPVDLLQSIHTPAYLSRLKRTSAVADHLDMETYTTQDTWQLALNAAGGAAAVAEAVWSGEARRGFALTRPPGHHATPTRGMGFCLLNNISLAAEMLLTNAENRTPKANRLAIIDLDLHHGNGTQEIFWNRADVFYMSIHQYPLFPGTGRVDECGSGAGEGTNANFPLPPGSGDNAFLKITQRLILPLLDRYKPEMLLVSFGTDPHWRDLLGSLRLSVDACGEMILKLTQWADQSCSGKIALFLEGGYDLAAGKACSLAAVAALLGEPWRDPFGGSPTPESTGWKDIFEKSLSIWKIG